MLRMRVSASKGYSFTGIGRVLAKHPAKGSMSIKPLKALTVGKFTNRKYEKEKMGRNEIGKSLD